MHNTFDIKLSNGGIMPKRNHGSAGYDLAIPHDAVLYHREQVIIDTGVAVHINRPDIAGIILPRSSTGSKGLYIENTVPLIDYGYIGNIILKVSNRHEQPIHLTKGERIAQLVFPFIFHPQFNLVEKHELSSRGAGSFGSSGTHG